LLIAIKPFLTLHEHFYKALNTHLRLLIDTHPPPHWFTANFVTYARTALLWPTLYLYKSKPALAAILVLCVDFGDFLDGVLARYWCDVIAKNQLVTEGLGLKNKNIRRRRESWVQEQRKSQYGGFIDAVLDKAYLVPLWITLLQSHYNIIFVVLILCEVAGGAVRFKAYYTNTGVTSASVRGYDFSSSAVTADHVGKAKQTFEMVGTAIFVAGLTTTGLLLLGLACPLSYESVRRKCRSRVVFVCALDGNKTNLADTVGVYGAARSLGSKLVVGCVNDDVMCNTCALACVDECVLLSRDDDDVIIGLEFMKECGIDYICILDINNDDDNDDVSTNNNDDECQSQRYSQELLQSQSCLLLKYSSSNRAAVVSPYTSKIKSE